MQKAIGQDGIDFAVIIPTFNRADTIDEAISSVLRQTHPAKEIIVVDDGSTDDTVRRLTEMDHPLIKVLVNERNMGATASRNRGARAATAEWIAFLDSDDTWHPEKLAAESTLIASERSDIVAVAANHRLVIDGRAGASSTAKEFVADVATKLRTENFLGTCSCMTARREPFLAIGGFDEHLKSCQDWDVWLRMAETGRIAISKPAHVFYRLNTRDCISTDGRKRQSGHLHIWKSHIRRGREFRGDRTSLALTFADLCHNRHKRRSFRKLCRYALKREPRRFRQIGAMLWHGSTAQDYLTYRRRMEQTLDFMQRLRSSIGLRRSGSAPRTREATAVTPA
ncbi:glycosyltransferase family A protein [Hyphomicrobium sp. CS1GBMeth3]|uniref:glycosyltransferase family 2 protein n=1 Tax=Hyphomicrobium sp. CS1GBMeth3 TaxID=1892845 RepID=UPI0009305985|nr:glycosyltransferase family A protein [Hyphomicrobium sp. CS1GBMeth3]